MIGSETFIIVAFMCSENRIPFDFASAICSSRNAVSAFLLMHVASSTSPSSSASPSLSTVTVPSAASCSIRTVVAAGIVTDCSFERKSPAPIVETWDFESSGQTPIRCGLFFAYSFTARGARRSEFPSRSTGFTALPLTLS